MTSAASSPVFSAKQAIAANDWASARRICRGVLADAPDDAEACYLLAVALCGDGETESAVPYLQGAVALAPRARWHRNLGVLYASLKRWEEALGEFERVLATEPNDADAVSYRGRALCELQRSQEAVQGLRAGLESAPEHIGIRTELGIALIEAGEIEESRALLSSVVAERPDAERALRYLIQVCVQLLRLEEAVRHAEALTRADDSASSWARLAIATWDHGDLTKALRARDEAFRRGITEPELHSAMLYISQYDAVQTPESLYRAHRLWAITHAGAPRRSWANVRDPMRRLRVGYVGMGLFSTPGRYFRLPLLQNSDREQFERVFYETEPEIGGRKAEGLAVCCDISRMKDVQAAEVIRGDGIDVLVDFGGHTRSARPGVFALRPAPVQVLYAGTPSTTGLREYDAFLTDAVMRPSGAEAFCSEPLWRLPSGSMMFPAPEGAPELTALPARANGCVTFGMFQRTAKLSAECYEAIARVLKEVSGARLLVHHTDPDFDDSGSAAVRRVVDEFAARAVSPERLHFRGLRPWADHIRIVAEADVALDTFPFNGQTTTCECLWMGVPVVTLLGRTHVARVGASLLHQVGERSWIATTPEEYVRIACTLANDLGELERRRQGLRSEMVRSPLCDTVRRTREIESVYRELWRRYCGV